MELPLTGFGTEPTTAQVELDILSRGDRFKRSAAILGISVVAALIALPIPLVHFVFVPGALVVGAVMAIARLRQGQIFRSVRGCCPFCAAEQSFTVLGRFTLPKRLYCEACHQQLVLERSTT